MMILEEHVTCRQEDQDQDLVPQLRMFMSRSGMTESKSR